MSEIDDASLNYRFVRVLSLFQRWLNKQLCGLPYQKRNIKDLCQISPKKSIAKKQIKTENRFLRFIIVGDIKEYWAPKLTYIYFRY